VEIPAEGLVHVTTLDDDHYYFDQAAHTLVGRRSGRAYRLGDKTRVVVARVDVDRRQLDFRLAASRADRAVERGRPVAPERGGPRSFPVGGRPGRTPRHASAPQRESWPTKKKRGRRNRRRR